MQPTCDPFYSTCWSQCFNESAGCYCQLNEAVIMVLHIQHWQHKRMWRRSSKGPVFLSFPFSCLITTRSGWPYSPPSRQRSSAIKGRWSDRLHLSFGWWLCCQKRAHHFWQVAYVANTQELNIEDIEGNWFCSGGSSNRQLRIRGLVEIRSQLLLGIEPVFKRLWQQGACVNKKHWHTRIKAC